MSSLAAPQRALSIRQLINPFTIVQNLWHYRDLIIQFTRRDIEGRYRGSYLGLLWSLIQPLAMLGIYTFVFGFVLRSRWPNARTDSLVEFAAIIFCGLTAFSIFSECVTRSPGLIIGVPNYVKKIVFPLEILPISVLGASLFQATISLAILLPAYILIGGSLNWTIILLPIVMLPMFFTSLGLMWFLASLGVFLRDIAPFVGLATQATFFLTPIFYNIDIIPEPIRTLISLNPMTHVVDNFRRTILWGTLPGFREIAVWTLVTFIFAIFGYTWFMKTKKAFADVL